MEHLKTLGFTRFDIFHYVTSKPSHFGSLIPGLLPGKAKCKVMKRVRDIIADANGIEKSSRICMNKGECAGTCPLCEKELLDLIQFISKRSFQTYYREALSWGNWWLSRGKFLTLQLNPAMRGASKEQHRVLGGSFTYGKAFTYALFLGYSKPEKF